MKNDTSIKSIVEKFLSSKNNYYGFEKSTVVNLILGSKDKPSIFITELDECYTSSYFNEKAYVYSVKEAVLAYSSKKDSAITIFKLLTAFIERTLGIAISIEYPPIPVSNSFERLMFIAKYLQDEKSNIKDLPDILWVNERTIEADLAKLRGYDGDPLQICGKEFVIDDDNIDRADGFVHFKSTVHPFFLTCNLTQVIGILKVLDELAKKDEWRGYIEPLSNQIWQQLSEYGKNRARFVLNELMPNDSDLIEKLDAAIDNTFYSECMCTNIGSNALMESMKNGKSCYIEYKDGDHTMFYENVIIKRYESEGYVVEVNGRELFLNAKDIVRSADSKDKMF